jgi:integrase
MNIDSVSIAPNDLFLAAIAALPALPRVIEYEDDYDEVVRSIKVDESDNQVALHVSGGCIYLQFFKVATRVRPLVRAYLLSSLEWQAPVSVVNRYNALLSISPLDIERLAISKPIEAKSVWPAVVAKYPPQTLASLKVLLGFLCRIRFGSWAPQHVDLVSYALPAGSIDIYSTVRSGDCFLTRQEETQLVRWIDAMALRASGLGKIEAEIASLVICSYQFGMRPKQLGMIRKRDCKVRISDEDGSAVVHLTFKMIKQRDAQLSKLPLVRKVKREWAAVFVALLANKAEDDADSFLFGFSNRIDLSASLIQKLNEIVPGAGLTSYDLRHSMAQRLVDSGASQEELASALGHSTLKTGLVYFQSSANQAELVNKALGASSIYQAVAKIAADRYISPDDLANLRGEMQIAGAPHGIPIAGIGGCTTGQPTCPYNPVTACYGCPKFMPVQDLDLHEQVLHEFRDVVLFFKDGGHGDMTSPAYLQLQRTIAEVQGVIKDLRAFKHE